MHIIYFVPNINVKGGISRIVFDKINYLINIKQYDIYLCYYGSLEETPVYSIDERVKKIVLPKFEGRGFLSRLYHTLSIVSNVKKILDDNKIDIAVNANAPFLIWILPFISKSTRKIHEFHFSYQGQTFLDDQLFGSSMKGFLIRKIRRFCLRKFDRVIALNESDRVKWNLQNVEVIPNFSNVVVSESSNLTNKIAVSVGRLEKQKSYDRLIDIWYIVHKKNPDWQLQIWGEGSLKTQLQLKIKKLDLQDSLLLCGVTDDVQNKYLGSSMFLLSSIYEGLPLVLVEAMQCGIPCISYNIIGSDSVIKDGYNGYLVEDKKEYVNKICNLIRDSRQRKMMGVNALESTKRFSKEIIMQKWMNLFDSVIS